MFDESSLCQWQWLLVAAAVSLPLLQLPTFHEARWAALVVGVIPLLLNVAVMLYEVSTRLSDLIGWWLVVHCCEFIVVGQGEAGRFLLSGGAELGHVPWARALHRDTNPNKVASLPSPVLQSDRTRSPLELRSWALVRRRRRTRRSERIPRPKRLLVRLWGPWCAVDKSLLRGRDSMHKLGWSSITRCICCVTPWAHAHRVCTPLPLVCAQCRALPGGDARDAHTICVAVSDALDVWTHNASLLALRCAGLFCVRRLLACQHQPEFSQKSSQHSLDCRPTCAHFPRP